MNGLIRRAAIAAFASAALLFAWAVERGSVERANRLHRRGMTSDAAEIYQANVDPTDVATRYNLGTALLDLQDVSARDELEAAVESPDPALRARALYNTGLWHLTQAIESEEGDSTRAFAQAAVTANRTALRLRPEDPDTKWNLAMAQRMLDSIDAARRRSGDDQGEGAVEADAVVQSELKLDVEAETELPDDAPQTGEDEAMAESEDEGMLSAAEAAEILGLTHLDSRLIVEKLLALEGRGYFGRRARGPRTPRR